MIPEYGREALAGRIRRLSLPDGGYPYYQGNASSMEPTLLTVLALARSGLADEAVRPGLMWCAGCQNPDGSVGLDAQHPHQGAWLTALAAIVFRHFGLDEKAARALDFVLSLRSVVSRKDPRLRQDDSLPGWPWIPGTSGWVEPTAWSLLALSLSGQSRSPRMEEGVRFLLDRQIPSGGWNYGSPALDGREFLPFWDTTGLALVALRGHGDPARVGPSVDLIEKNQGMIESLSGLSWAVLCLEGFQRDSGPAKIKLLNVMTTLRDDELHAANYSLGLIALSGGEAFLS